MKKLLTVLSVLFISFTLTACAMNKSTYDSKNPQAVAKKFSESVYEGDTKTVLKLIHIPKKIDEVDGSRDLLRGIIKNTLQKAKKIAEKKGGIDSISTEKPKYSDDKKRATVKTIIRFKNGSERKRNVRLLLTNTGWKVGSRF